MKTRAAVALEAGKPLEVMEVNLDGPKAGEVLVEIKATGICHTDEFTLSGADPEGAFPAIVAKAGWSSGSVNSEPPSTKLRLAAGEMDSGSIFARCDCLSGILSSVPLAAVAC